MLKVEGWMNQMLIFVKAELEHFDRYTLRLERSFNSEPRSLAQLRRLCGTCKSNTFISTPTTATAFDLRHPAIGTILPTPWLPMPTPRPLDVNAHVAFPCVFVYYTSSLSAPCHIFLLWLPPPSALGSSTSTLWRHHPLERGLNSAQDSFCTMITGADGATPFTQCWHLPTPGLCLLCQPYALCL